MMSDYVLPLLSLLVMMLPCCSGGGSCGLAMQDDCSDDTLCPCGLVNIVGSGCLPGVELDSYYCVHSGQCQLFTCNSVCQAGGAGKCVCAPGFFSSDKQCLPTRPAGGPCGNVDQCSDRYNRICHDGVCTCPTGWLMDSGDCFQVTTATCSNTVGTHLTITQMGEQVSVQGVVENLPITVGIAPQTNGIKLMVANEGQECGIASADQLPLTDFEGYLVDSSFTLSQSGTPLHVPETNVSVPYQLLGGPHSDGVDLSGRYIALVKDAAGGATVMKSCCSIVVG